MNFVDNILPQVTKPARYTGGEWNAIRKDWDQASLRIALAYPDLYEIGMSNLAIPILYNLLNSQPDVLTERVFAPWLDMGKAMRQAGIPLFSLESRHPLKEFDIVGFSLGYELTYSNILYMLDLAQIPLFSRERDDSFPLVIAGGSCALNPEPMADFIDLFVIGEGEEVVPELLEVFRQWRRAGRKAMSKQELLRQAASLRGIYVPSLYQVDYHTDGTIASISPLVSEAKPKVERRIVSQLPPPVTRPVVPYVEVIHDRGAVEIQRGCTSGCRFCQAGMIYRPLRERPHHEVDEAVGALLRHCGYNEISLVSLSTSDYNGIEELVTTLYSHYGAQNLTLSLPSLRMDSSSIKLLSSLPTGKKVGLTFAPEAGTDRLRRAINKGVTEEEINQMAAFVADKGWRSLKLYFMLGLPTETMQDIQGIVDMVTRMLKSRGAGKRLTLRVSLSPFVPKPHTPYQWEPQQEEEELAAKYQVVRQGLRRLGVHLSWQEPKVTLLEAVFSRGDRRLGKVLHRAWQLGCCFDAWSECFNFDRWLTAFNDCALSPSFYAHRRRSQEELLPWSIIDTGTTTAFLRREYQRTLEEQETPDCRHRPCSLCGLERLCAQRNAVLGVKSGSASLEGQYS